MKKTTFFDLFLNQIPITFRQPIWLMCLFVFFVGGAGYAQILNESFNATTLPTGWTNEFVTGTTNWTTVTTNGNSSISPRTGARMAEFRMSNSSAKTKLVTPVLDLTTVTNPQLTFYYANVNWFGDVDELRVFYKTSATGTWTSLGVYTQEKASWTKVEIVLPNPSATYYIAFEGKSNWARGLNLDDVTVGAAPTCIPPTNVNVSNITTSGATLSWTASVTPPSLGYDYQVRTDNNPGPTGAITSGSVGAGVLTTNVTGLQANTTYYAFVKAKCSATDNSEWSQAKVFLTPCSSSAIPYTMPINATTGTALPSCVVMQDVNNDGYKWESTSAQTGITGRVMKYSYSFSNAANDWFYTNGLNLTGGQSYRLKFKYKDSGDIEKLKVSWGNSPINTAMTNQLVSIVTGTSSTAVEQIVDFIPTTTGVYYIGFQANSDANSYNLYVGEINVDLSPSCITPTNVQATAITKNSATINWTAPNPAPASGYEFEIRTSGLPGSGAAGIVQSGTTAAGVVSKALTGLLPSTEYSIYVRSVCAATNKSVWSEIKKFTTLCDYPDLISTTPASRCGVGTVNLSASYSSGTVSWYSSATSGTVLGTGNTFTTPEISTTTSYWVSSQIQGGLSTAGRTSPQSVSSFSSTDTGVVFDVVQSVQLQSVDVYSTSAGTIDVKIVNSAGTELYATGSVNINGGGGTTPNTIPLNFTVPSGTGYRMVIKSTNGANLLRESGVAGFPYVGSDGNLKVTNGYFLGNSTSYYYFYNIKYIGTCATPRKEVVATVTPAPALTLSATTAEICEGTSTPNVAISSGSANYSEYVWEPATGVAGDAATGWTFQPTETTTYTLTASNSSGCSVKRTMVVNVKPLPNFTPLEEEYAVCQNVIQELNTNAVSEAEIIIGTATTKTGSSDDETAFLNRWSNSRQQYLFTKAELNALGFTSGSIKGLAFEVASLGSSANNTNYTIKMKQVSNSTVTSTTFITDGLTTVYGPVAQTHTASGWQVITFTTPFVWDGTSNVLLELTHGGINSLDNAQTYYTQTTDNMGVVSHSATGAGTLTKKRLNTKFYVVKPVTVTWSPSADLYTNEAATVPYAGESLSKVYFKRSEAVSDAAYEVTISGANGCSTTLTTSISVPLIDTPEVAPQQFCSAIATSEIVATTEGGDLKWYNSATSETEITTISHSGVYYVSAESLGCKSDRVAVVITIAGVNAPTATPVQNFCGGATIASLSATSTTGHPLGWYSSATSTEELSADTVLVTGTTYYVSEKVSNCESARVAVLVHVKPTPNSLPSQTYGICGFKTLANAEVGAQANATVTWYSSATANQAMNSNTQIVTGTYYASQTVDGCESARVAISFTVTQNLSVPTASAQTFCGSATVSQLVATGGQTGAVYLWYPTATATVPLSGTTALSNGTYYVSQKVGDCESGRKAVSVSLANTAAPSVSPYTFCTSATVADLTMPALSGVSYKWYSSPTSTNPLSSNTALVHNTTYYVSKVQGACESSRVGALVTILPAPSAPTGPTVQNFEIDIPSDATIGDLIVDQPNVVWYISLEDAKTNHNPLQSNMPLVNGQTYYGVLIGANGCPSAALAVTVGVSLDAPEFDRSMLKYYPNPVKDNLQISYKNVIDKVVVYNIIGQRVKEQKFQTTDVQVQMGDLSVGTYMLELHSKDQVQFIKIIKK